MRQLVGFAGLIGSGKTTAAIYLIAEHRFVNVKFAGPLKDMCKALGLTDDEINGPLKEQPCALLDGKTPRWAQQSLGTEWGRNCISPNLWTNAWQRRLAQMGDINVCCDDVRFPNEAALIRELGGQVIMVVREGQKQGEHVSERFDFEPDLIIYNNGTIGEFETKVARALGVSK